MEIQLGQDTIAQCAHALRELHGLLKKPSLLTTSILEWNAPTKECAIAKPANAFALKTTTERHAKGLSARMIALGEEFACLRNL